MTKIVIALLSLAAPLACAALPSGSPSGAAAPGEEKVVQMKGVMSLSPAMVKEINEGGALTISSPSFPSGYYTVYRFVSSRGNVVQAFSVLERNQLQAQTKVIKFTTLTVDERLSDRTSFPIGEKVIYIQRIRLIDKKPVILDNNIFLKSEVPGLTEEIAGHSIYAYLENELHMQITTSKRKITAERASEMDTRLLDLKDYDFVAAVTSHTYNSRGVMFEWTQSRHRPDYFEFYDTASRKTAAEINI